MLVFMSIRLRNWFPDWMSDVHCLTFISWSLFSLALESWGFFS